MPTLNDYLIVGAGPAGLLCAKKLAESGKQVQIIEASPTIKRKVCGEYLCPQGVILLRKEGLGAIADSFPKVYGMKLVNGNGTEVETTFPEAAVGISVNRKELEEKLLEYALESGSKVSFGAGVKDIHWDTNHWRVKLYNGEVYRARFLIGADGRRSVVAKVLKMRQSTNQGRIAAHCWLPVDYVTDRQGEMHIFKDGSYIGIDPTARHEVNISIVTDVKNIKKHGKGRHLLNSYIDQSVSLSKSIGQIPGQIKVHSVFPIMNKVSDVTGKQAALIGDAAGFLDPLTGEGMYNALWMGMTLADELNCQEDVSQALLNYKKTRQATLGRKTLVNRVFQFLIRRPWLTELLARYLLRNRKKADAFIGLIGNVYSPGKGIKQVLFN